MFRLACLCLLALGCAAPARTLDARTAAPYAAHAPEAAGEPMPRLGPLAGAGSGVRRVDVALR